MISIAMATYNGAKYIKEQIDSILNQTIQDFELVVCDDCSKDDTFDILQEYATNDKRIHIFKNEKNLGFKKNFEKAISLCKGEYIALSDQDDIWTNNHLETLVKLIGDKAIACGNSDLIDKNGKELGMTLKYQESFDWYPQNDRKKIMSIVLFRNPYQGATMLINKNILKFILPFPEDVLYHDTWISSVACFVGGISYSDIPIMKYRRLDTSITGYRNKRKSKILHLRYSKIGVDKFHLVVNLKKRIPNLTKKDKRLLNKLENVCNRNSSRQGRLRNSIYMLRHYKTVFNCDNLHWI